MSRLDRQPITSDYRLWLLVLLSFLGYLAVALWFPLGPHFDTYPLADIRSLASGLTSAAVYALLLSALFLFYWLAYRRVRGTVGGLPLGVILAVAALFAIPLLFTFPINATDVYGYFIRGRLTALQGVNPFTVTPSDVPGDPFAFLLGEWQNVTTPYGPLWEMIAAGLSGLTARNLFLGLLVYKGVSAAAHIASTGVIWMLLKQQKPAIHAGISILWAWNPALLFIFVLDGHNDSLMIFFLLLGWLALSKSRYTVGLILLVAALLIKPIALLALPYLIVGAWLKLPDKRLKMMFPFLVAAVGLVAVTLAFLPFGSPFELISRLYSEARTGGGFSPQALIILQAREFGVDIPFDLLANIGALFLILVAVGLLIMTWRGRSPLRSAADIFGSYILQAFRFRIWYAAWPFPWLLLDSGSPAADPSSARARLAAGQLFLLCSQLSVLIYGQLRTDLLGGSQTAAHLIGVAFSFGVPVAAALAVYAYNRHLYRRQKEKSVR